MTVTNLSAIKVRLTVIATSIKGIKRAFAEAPTSLPDADLPLMIPFVGPTTAFGMMSETLAEETRTIQLRLYVAHIQKGYPGEAEAQVEPFLTSVRDGFLAHPGLGLGTSASQLPFFERAKWLGDGGIVVLPFAGENYLGAEFKISVTNIVPIKIAPFE